MNHVSLLAIQHDQIHFEDTGIAYFHSDIFSIATEKLHYYLISFIQTDMLHHGIADFFIQPDMTS